MVDHRSFVKMNPSYNMGNSSPHNAHFQRMRAAVLQQHIKDWASSTSLMPATGFQQPEDSDSSLRRDELPDDESLRLAPAVVYGFSFSLQKGGCFPVTGFSEISFDDHTFDRHLVMSNEVQKTCFLASSHSTSKTQSPWKIGQATRVCQQSIPFPERARAASSCAMGPQELVRLLLPSVLPRSYIALFGLSVHWS